MNVRFKGLPVLVAWRHEVGATVPTWVSEKLHDSGDLSGDLVNDEATLLAHLGDWIVGTTFLVYDIPRTKIVSILTDAAFNNAFEEIV